MYTNVVDHAKSFADFLKSKTLDIHKILRKYQSKEVVDDEIRRSIETLQSMQEIEQYFDCIPFVQHTATFLPLNLPLYSLVLFAAIPAYQSTLLTIKVPQKMQEMFIELLDALSFGIYYPNINIFKGSRSEFLSGHCATASVVIFTGKYENFVSVRKACCRDTLVLYNGVGHNPLVITPSADINSAVEKSLQVKLFNNGQDCAGPDIILVHSMVIDSYLESLLTKLSQVKCGSDYNDDNTRIGPLFETSSLLDNIKLILKMCQQGAKILYGGHIDLKHNIMHPCVMKGSIRQVQNFTELYCPLLLVIEYEQDQELATYFNDAGSRYQHNEMYISLFGESDYITKMCGSIILKDCTIHDIERGTEEYGGYGPGASQVSYQKISIPKPLLIPREIHNFLSPQKQKIHITALKTIENWEQWIVTTQFQKIVQRIFGEQLVFAYIFGSFATGKGKRYSDIDTFICVHNKQAIQIEQYLNWLFSIHEIFGRIPDFKYPAEIVSFAELQAAITKLPTLELSVELNKTATYDTKVWCHSLSQPWIGEIQTQNIPQQWRQLFPAHSLRILRSLIKSLENMVISNKSSPFLELATYKIPRQEPELSHFIYNLSGQGLLEMSKIIPYDEKPVYPDIVLQQVAKREFMGRKVFSVHNSEHLYHPCFRFGVVASPKKRP